MKGFTLLETIVAISVLTIVILGPLAVATTILSNSSFSSNQVIAYNLAEEGVEFVINKRDSLIFKAVYDGRTADDGWNDFKSTMGGSSQCQNASKKCGVNVTNGAVFDCGSGSYPANQTCTLRKNSTTGIYSYAPGDPITIFERRIFVESGGSDEKQVTVTITWREKNGGQRSFTLERYVYNRK
ncbi:hypothetical protein A3I27_03170 [Candidatus Giovannonibacteria bacterium RIFCSPLOWO2_02_FULL_43_11b]|nr:MAG: hypothetical protein A3I27_03170 [Candidatus Giovannonibacteria bacterium RIFCSPLOWO2_02_FULL_43_11b]